MHFFSIKEVYKKKARGQEQCIFLVLNNCTKYFVKKNVEHKIRKLVEKKNKINKKKRKKIYMQKSICLAFFFL